MLGLTIQLSRGGVNYQSLELRVFNNNRVQCIYKQSYAFALVAVKVLTSRDAYS